MTCPAAPARRPAWGSCNRLHTVESSDHPARVPDGLAWWSTPHGPDPKLPPHPAADRGQRLLFAGRDHPGRLTPPAAAPDGRRGRAARRTGDAPARAAWPLFHRGADRRECRGHSGRRGGGRCAEPPFHAAVLTVGSPHACRHAGLRRVLHHHHRGVHRVCRPLPQTPGHGQPGAAGGAPAAAHAGADGGAQAGGVAVQPQHGPAVQADGPARATRRPHHLSRHPGHDRSRHPGRCAGRA